MQAEERASRFVPDPRNNHAEKACQTQNGDTINTTQPTHHTHDALKPRKEHKGHETPNTGAGPQGRGQENSPHLTDPRLNWQGLARNQLATARAALPLRFAKPDPPQLRHPDA